MKTPKIVYIPESVVCSQLWCSI